MFPLKFEGGTPRPPSKLQSATIIIVFAYYFTYYILNKYVMRCAIWYHLYNLKNVKSNHGQVLL